MVSIGGHTVGTADHRCPGVGDVLVQRDIVAASCAIAGRHKAHCLVGSVQFHQLIHKDAHGIDLAAVLTDITVIVGTDVGVGGEPVGSIQVFVGTESRHHDHTGGVLLGHILVQVAQVHRRNTTHIRLVGNVIECKILILTIFHTGIQFLECLLGGHCVTESLAAGLFAATD